MENVKKSKKGLFNLNGKLKKDANLKKNQKQLQKETLISDLKFMELSKHKFSIQEIIREIKGDKTLVLKNVIAQKKISFDSLRCVILDCEAELPNGDLVNVEVQVANNDDIAKRIRYYQSSMTIDASQRQEDFKYKDVPNIITIFICNFNMFRKQGLDESIYKVRMTIEGTDVEYKNGTETIIVNLKCKKADERFREFAKILTTVDYTNDEFFPELSRGKRIVNYLKIREGEKGDMYSGVAGNIYIEGKEDGLEQGQISILASLVNEKMITLKYAAKKLGMSEKKFKKIMENN